MQLEDYFNFLSPDDIRLKGHRIGIDNILTYYLEGYTPEEIAAVYPELSLEEIYATITYYYHNRPEVDAYLLRLKQWRRQRYQEWLETPSPVVQRIKAMKVQRFPSFENCGTTS